jgi:hypothetical protein
VDAPTKGRPVQRAAFPDDEADVTYARRGGDHRWLPAPTREDGNSAWVPEAPRDGVLYGRNGRDGLWLPIEAAGIWIGPNPPPNATPGTLWWRNDPDGELFILYEDPTSTQWVPAARGQGGGGIEEAPLDGRPYSRQSGTWTRSTAASQFLYGEYITLPGNELVNANSPSIVIAVPPSSLPDQPCQWLAGGGLGAILVSNVGLPLPIATLPAGPTFNGFVEIGFDSGNWINMGSSLNISQLNNANYETIIRSTVTATAVTGRIFYYDPAVDTNGIRVGIGVGSGTNPGYPPTSIWFGIEGQIVHLGAVP